MTEPRDDAPAPELSAARRGGVLAGALAVAALAAALVVFLAGGHPYSTNVAGGALYLGGLGVGLTASVLLWMAWSERADAAPSVRARAGARVTATALLLTCACAVVTLTDVASGNAQLWLLAVTAVVLAAAVLLAPPDGRADPTG